MSATLIHGDKTTIYYTKTAYLEVLNTSADGDVIILSPGTFNKASITKSVSIYDSGFNTYINNI